MMARRRRCSGVSLFVTFASSRNFGIVKPHLEEELDDSSFEFRFSICGERERHRKAIPEQNCLSLLCPASRLNRKTARGRRFQMIYPISQSDASRRERCGARAEQIARLRAVRPKGLHIQTAPSSKLGS